MLKEHRILYHQVSGEPFLEALCQPQNLRTLPRTHLDRHGLPLFLDRPGRNRKYPSLRYQQEDVEVLRTAFHLRDIEDVRMFHRIKQDLESSGSIMKNADTDDDWHSRAANLITSILERSPNVGRIIEEELFLIPFSDGSWGKAAREDLSLLPAPDGPIIPQDLILTIHPEAVRNPSRMIMFERLRATQCNPVSVIDRLWVLYSQHGGASNLDASKEHLGFLYWHFEDINDPRFSRLWLYDTCLTRVTCRHGLIYVPSDDEYGPRELLKSVPDPHSLRPVIPEYRVPYVNADYMDLFSPHTRRHDLSWFDWLERALGVRRILRLKYDAGSLSPEMRHVLRYRPEKIIGTLKRHWGTYKRQMNSRIEEEISHAKVACLNAPPANLPSSYFPLPSLRQKVQELGITSRFSVLGGSRSFGGG